MIRATGTIGGRNYDQENISLADLKKAIPEIQSNLDSLKEYVNFEVADIYKMKHRGQERQPEQVGVNPETQFVYNGERIVLRYYTGGQTAKQGKNGFVPEKLTPNRIFIKGGVLQLSKRDDQELLVFLLLHSSNANGINAKPGTPSLFKVVKERDNAKAAIKAANADLQFREKVLKGEATELKLRAEGCGLGNFASYSDDEVREAIMNAYENAKIAASRSNGDPQIAGTQFINKFLGATATVRGNIMAARAKGIVFGFVSQTTNKHVWKWVNGVDDEIRDKVIVECPQGSDPDDILYRYMVNEPEQMKILDKTLAEMQKGEAAASSSSKKK